MKSILDGRVFNRHWAWLRTVGTLRRYDPSGLLMWQVASGLIVDCRDATATTSVWVIVHMPSSCGHLHSCEAHARSAARCNERGQRPGSTAAARRKVRTNGEVAARRAARCNIRGTHLGLAAAAQRSGHTGCDACCFTHAGNTFCSECLSTSVFVHVPCHPNLPPFLQKKSFTFLRGEFRLAEVCHREFLATNIVSAIEAVTHGATPPRRKFRR